MAGFVFQVIAENRDSRARAGVLTTPHGAIETPAFIPVATQGTVKGVSAAELMALGAQILLGNTYHLYLRPGSSLIAQLGGLHTFMGWNGPILTDSGGFQVFSLGAGREQGVGKIASIFPEDAEARGSANPSLSSLVQVDEDGVTFVSHLDGSRHRFTPERSMAIQRELGADIVLAFDECTSPLSGYDYTREAMARTHRWAERCLRAAAGGSQALFGIVQGGEYRELRQDSSRYIAALPFDGYAVGGSLGKSKADMHRVLDWTLPLLPRDRPRHLLGIGEPEDIVEGVARGVDLFDCALPTRMGRNGTVMTAGGRMNLLNTRYRDDPAPIDEECRCYTCSNFSRAYLNHLFKSGEPLGPTLATVHSLCFVVTLCFRLREAVLNGTFTNFAAAFLAGYKKRAP